MVLLTVISLLPVGANAQKDIQDERILCRFSHADAGAAIRAIFGSLGARCSIDPEIEGPLDFQVMDESSEETLNWLSNICSVTYKSDGGVFQVNSRDRVRPTLKLEVIDGGDKEHSDQVVHVLEAVNTDIRVLFNELAEKFVKGSGDSFWLAPQVRGTISVSLHNVTVETAIQQICRMVHVTRRASSKYEFVRRDDYVFGPTLKIKKGKGGKFWVDAEQADLRTFLYGLFQEKDASFTATPGVTGLVTMHLKEVPFKEVLTLALRQASATVELRDGIYNVTGPRGKTFIRSASKDMAMNSTISKNNVPRFGIGYCFSQ